MKKDRKSNSEYWNKNLSSWERSAYFKDESTGQKSTMLDRFSTYFRGDSIYNRMDGAFKIIKEHVPGLKILDVGCASGRFSVRMLEAGADSVIGVDVATSAIEMANQRLRGSPYEDKASFTKIDVTEKDGALPDVALVTSLGVIEYFDKASLEAFMSNLSTRYFLFSFPLKPDTPAKFSFRGLLRSVYLMGKGCPGVFRYTKNEFSSIANKYGFNDVRFVSANRQLFVTNLPEVGAE